MNIATTYGHPDTAVVRRAQSALPCNALPTRRRTGQPCTQTAPTHNAGPTIYATLTHLVALLGDTDATLLAPLLDLDEFSKDTLRLTWQAIDDAQEETRQADEDPFAALSATSRTMASCHALGEHLRSAVAPEASAIYAILTSAAAIWPTALSAELANTQPGDKDARAAVPLLVAAARAIEDERELCWISPIRDWFVASTRAIIACETLATHLAH